MNIRSIARLAGVSVATVSRTLSGKDPEKVSPRTREKILSICEEQRYSPNVHMLRISRKCAGTVSFLFPPDSYYNNDRSGERMDDNLGAAIMGAQAELDLNSTSLLLTSISERFLAEKEYIRLHRSKTVDGMLIWGWTEQVKYLDELVAEGIPIVMLQGNHEGRIVNSVKTADEEGMRTLVDYAVKCGHHRIAISAPMQTSSAGRERLAGVRNALRAHKLSPSWVSKERDFSVKAGYEACNEILSAAPDTTCVIGQNDLAALGIIKAAQAKGCRVPEDLSVTGADGIDLYGQVDLTTYAAQSFTVGREAAKLLKLTIDEPDRAPEQIRVPVRLIEGNTVTTLRKNTPRA